MVSLCRDRWNLLALIFCCRLCGLGLVVLNVIAALAPLLQAVAIGRLVDQVRRTSLASSSTAVLTLSALLIASEIVSSLRRLAADHLVTVIDQSFRQEVRRRLDEVVDLSVIEDQQVMDDVSRTGDVGEGGARSPGAAATGQLLLLSRFTAAFASATPLAIVSPLAAVTLIVLSLVNRAIVRRDFTRLAADWDRREWARRRAAYWTDVATDPGYAAEIRIFGLSEWVVRRRAREYVAWLGDMLRVIAHLMRKQTGIFLLSFASASVALAVPAYAALSDELSVGDLATVLVASIAALSISAMGYEAFDIEHGLEAVAARTRLAVDGPVTPRPAIVGSEGEVTAANQPMVALREVAFAYPTDTECTIKSLTLELHAGRVTALVGLNGAGKTTLIKLLTGLYAPDQGNLEVDGVPIVTFEQRRSWQRHVSVVFQNFVKYPMTVRSNVGLGAPEAEMADIAVWRALEAADCADVVRQLPHGLDTLLAPYRRGGIDLSGGQWQKIALARSMFALQHGRRLLILDEPTANMDTESESTFYARVVASLREVPILLISHRLATVRRAETIVFMSGGEIGEVGSHDTLMAVDGEYARLFHMQASHYDGAMR